MTDKEKQMEEEMAAHIEDALGLEEMAARLVPRTAAEKELTTATIDYATRVANNTVGGTAARSGTTPSNWPTTTTWSRRSA